jgi:integrase
MAPKATGLTSRKVETMKTPGHYGDGGGLYLQITGDGDKSVSKSWIYRYQINGRRRDMGLGPVALFSLAEAREKALAARRLVYEGIDPIEAKAAKTAEQKRAEAAALTFEQCAERYIEAHKAGWKNAKHGAQWTATLKAYVYPSSGSLPISGIDTELVLKILEPIWTTKAETASRVRGRIEAILDWAKTLGYRSGENPARWKGHLDHLLPARSKVAKQEHHAALPWAEAGAFMAALRGQEGISARALEFAILTAVRTSEALGATWGEIDLASKLWTVPAERMKAGREHRVPLSEAAIGILNEMAKKRVVSTPDAPLFPGAKAAKPLSNMALLMTLRRMKRDDLTTHGFRSTFRDWVSEQTDYPGDVAEMALAHAIGDAVEAAYRRGDLFEKRRRMMDEWATFCATVKPAAKGRE